MTKLFVEQPLALPGSAKMYDALGLISYCEFYVSSDSYIHELDSAIFWSAYCGRFYAQKFGMVGSVFRTLGGFFGPFQTIL